MVERGSELSGGVINPVTFAVQPPLALELARRNKLEHLLPFTTVEGAAKAYSHYDNLQQFLDLRDATLSVSVGTRGVIISSAELADGTSHIWSARGFRQKHIIRTNPAIIMALVPYNWSAHGLSSLHH